MCTVYTIKLSHFTINHQMSSALQLIHCNSTDVIIIAHVYIYRCNKNTCTYTCSHHRLISLSGNGGFHNLKQLCHVELNKLSVVGIQISLFTVPTCIGDIHFPSLHVYNHCSKPARLYVPCMAYYSLSLSPPSHTRLPEGCLSALFPTAPSLPMPQSGRTHCVGPEASRERYTENGNQPPQSDHLHTDLVPAS